MPNHITNHTVYVFLRPNKPVKSYVIIIFTRNLATTLIQFIDSYMDTVKPLSRSLVSAHCELYYIFCISILKFAASMAKKRTVLFNINSNNLFLLK